MTNFSRKFGRGGKNARYGQGEQISSVPAGVPKLFNDFSGGFESRVLREGVPLNSSPSTKDMEVSKKNRLRRAPGITILETLAGRTPLQIISHHSLDLTTELLLVDPSFLGVKAADATVWTDLGLVDSANLYAFAHYGETLIIMNRVNDPWSREPGGVLTAEPTIPQGTTVASFAGRVYIGGAYVDGRYEPMGVMWCAADGNFRDFLGLGSGFELLLDDISIGDRIVAFKTMGLGLMAVLCRKSIWVGALTGDPNRPANFEPREGGTGIVSARTAQVTAKGVTFLSDDGVRAFDGNSSRVVSEQINGELLPLSEPYSAYHSSYNPLTKLYKLHTPTETWTWDVEKERWFRSSIVSKSAAVFATQMSGVTWGDLVGDWSSLAATTWGELGPSQADIPDMIHLGLNGADWALGEEDYASELGFGNPRVSIVPFWDSQMERGLELRNLVTTQGISFEYTGSGTVRFFLTDIEGQMEEILSQPLVAAITPRTMWLPVIDTGLGSAVRVQIGTGQLEIIQYQLKLMPRGPRIESQPFFPREYQPDFET